MEETTWEPSLGPTSIEVRLYLALDTLGVNYRHQTRFGHYTVDAYLPEYHAAIEADGCRVHQTCAVCGTSDPTALRKMLRRDGNLAKYSSLPVVHIRGHALEDGPKALQSVKTALRLLRRKGRRDGFDDGDVFFTEQAILYARPRARKER